MLTDLMRSKLEDLAIEFTRSELMDLRDFLKMATEVRGMTDGILVELKGIIDSKGNPNRWNLDKLVVHEMNKRSALRAIGRTMANIPSTDPMWEGVFTRDKTGTQVPLLGDYQGNRTPTKPQPGDR